MHPRERFRSDDGPVLAATPADYCAVRSLTELLAEPLSAEDQTVQSMPDVSPTKWHRAHTTWFFETFVLRASTRRYEPLEPAYRMLFNSYYEGVGPKYPRSQRGADHPAGRSPRSPRTAATSTRRCSTCSADAHARDAACRRHGRARAAPRAAAPGAAADGHQARPVAQPAAPAYRPAPRRRATSAAPTAWVDVDGGLVEVGHHGDGFCFDNELPRHRAYVHPFRLADGLVTAGEWRAFIDDGGYQRADLWLSDGWYAVQDRAGTRRCTGSADGDGWLVHTLGGTRPVDDGEPVVPRQPVRGRRLRPLGRRPPADRAGVGAGRRPRCPSPRPGRSTSTRCTRRRPTDHVAGDALHQVFGECWQWTSSAYLPYPGFAPAPGAVGEYNGKFMSGQMVLRGSSAFTPPGHARPTYRNFFPPQARWALTGVRLATDG